MRATKRRRHEATKGNASGQFSPSSLPRSVASSLSAFTLVELLVVIGIIAILLGILIPVVNRVRIGGYVADTKNFISQLQGAIERYHTDFGAYPGPFKNEEIYNATPASCTPPVGTITFNAPVPPPAGFDPALPTQAKITMGENCVLGLVGGLRVDTSALPAKLVYDPSAVGLGPVNLGSLNNTSIPPKRYNPYIETKQLSWRDGPAGKTGQYKDESASADDTVIPEFVDRFTAPMPVLVLRARRGAPIVSPTATGFGNSHNGVVTDNNYSATVFREAQYDLSQVLPYTAPDPSGHYIGESKDVKKSGSVHGLRTVNTNATLTAPPYDAYPYLLNPAMANTPRAKDGFILISAGADRVYGTNDDITTFGDVAP